MTLVVPACKYPSVVYASVADLASSSVLRAQAWKFHVISNANSEAASSVPSKVSELAS